MIYGIGLPRTGTRNLAKALQEFNLKGIHFCILDNCNDPSTTIAEERADYIVNNSYFKKWRQLFKKDSTAKFILTTRNKEDWLKSISKYEIDLPDIIKYRQKVEDFFSEQGNLLILDINSENKWEQLSDFLGFLVPKESYPGD